MGIGDNNFSISKKISNPEWEKLNKHFAKKFIDIAFQDIEVSSSEIKIEGEITLKGNR